MFVKIAIIVALVAVAAKGWVPDRPYEGVNPNSLQCDPLGQVFLLLPDYEDCNIFYMCTHGQEVRFQCSSPELIFDFEQQTCAWPWNGKCTLRTHDDGSEGGEEGSGGELEGSGEEWAANEITESEQRHFSQFSPTSNILNCLKPSFLSRRAPYKGDCQRYWRCSGRGVLESAYCNDGLFFNAQTEQCDFEANVKCDTELTNELGGEFIIYE